MDRPAVAVVVSGRRCRLGVVVARPYVVLTPGPVIDVLGTNDGKPLITDQGCADVPDRRAARPHHGQRVRGAARPGAAQPGVWPGCSTRASRSCRLVLIYPAGESGEEVEEENTQEMLQSQDSAAIAALRHLGLPVTLTVSVTAVLPARGRRHLEGRGPDPSRRRRRRSRRGVQVRGRGPQALGRARRRRSSVRREVTRTSPPGHHARRTDDPGRLGRFTSHYGYTSPVKVTIRLEDVGGPSAGLMFKPRHRRHDDAVQENGGLHVAGTGTITRRPGRRDRRHPAEDGRRPDRAAPPIFLVPAANCARRCWRSRTGSGW